MVDVAFSGRQRPSHLFEWAELLVGQEEQCVFSTVAKKETKEGCVKNISVWPKLFFKGETGNLGGIFRCTQTNKKVPFPPSHREPVESEILVGQEE